MDDKTLVRKGRVKLFLSVLALGVITVAEVVAFLVVMFLNIPYESLWTDVIIECLGAAAAMGCVLLLGGRSLVSVSRDDVAYTFRFGWWCLAISVVLMALELFWGFEDGTPLASDWLPRLLETALLCLGIGIMEEFMFRGIVFNGLLATMGSTHKGVVRAIIVTSVLFGLAHVDFETDFVDGLSVIQALLKTCQTGMYSFMLCVIMLRTHRLGGVSLFHGFDDFVLVMPSIALFGEALDTEYVVQGDDAIPTIMYYLVIIALYLPFVVKSGLELRRGQDVTRGAFMEKYVAQQQEQAQLAAAPEPAAPAMSLGCPAAPVASSPVQFDVPVPTTPPSASDYKPLETLMVPDAAFVTPEGIGTPATPEATVVPVASMAHAPVAEPVTPAEAQVASVTSQVGVGGPAPVVQDTPSMPGPAPAGASRATGLPPIPKGL